MKNRIHNFLARNLFLFFLIPLAGKSGEIPQPEPTTFIQAEAVAAQEIYSVFAVQVPRIDQTKTNWFPIGTGFFVNPTANSKQALCVTCNHVIEAVKHLNQNVIIGLDTKEGYKRISCTIVYQDPTNDIAIIAPKIETNTSTHINKIINNLAVGPDMIDDSEIALGRGVLVIGYPLMLGIDADKNHPIVRFGMVAQDAEGNSFIIDGMASHGNSGSPVFVLTSNKQPLIGMVTSFQTDKISLLDENGELAGQLPYNSGLTKAVKASTIRKAIDIASHSLSLTP